MKDRLRRIFIRHYRSRGWARILLVLPIPLLYSIPRFYSELRDWYVPDYCAVGQTTVRCVIDFQTYVFDPISRSHESWIILLFLLALLPFFLLRGWFLFVSWWALPLAAYNILTAPNSTGGFFESSTAAATVQSAYSLIAVTIGYVILHLLLRTLVRIFRKKQH